MVVQGAAAAEPDQEVFAAGDDVDNGVAREISGDKVGDS
jgi:hypothetical protein